MKSLQLGHVTNNNGLISTFVRSVTSPWTKRDDQYYSEPQIESLFFRKLVTM